MRALTSPRRSARKEDRIELASAPIIGACHRSGARAPSIGASDWAVDPMMSPGATSKPRVKRIAIPSLESLLLDCESHIRDLWTRAPRSEVHPGETREL